MIYNKPYTLMGINIFEWANALIHHQLFAANASIIGLINVKGLPKAGQDMQRLAPPNRHWKIFVEVWRLNMRKWEFVQISFRQELLKQLSK
jgi:hypothetical protein